jgi:hypothetical protein
MHTLEFVLVCGLRYESKFTIIVLKLIITIKFKQIQ